MSHWIFTVTDQYYENASCREYWTAKQVYFRRMQDQFWGIEWGAANTNRIRITDQVVFYIAAQQFRDETLYAYEGKYFAGTCVLRSPYSAVYDPEEIRRLRMGDCDPRYDRIDGVKLRDIRVFTNPVSLEVFNPGIILHGSIHPISAIDFAILVNWGQPEEPLPNRPF